MDHSNDNIYYYSTDSFCSGVIPFQLPTNIRF